MTHALSSSSAAAAANPITQGPISKLFQQQDMLTSIMSNLSWEMRRGTMRTCRIFKLEAEKSVSEEMRKTKDLGSLFHKYASWVTSQSTFKKYYSGGEKTPKKFPLEKLLYSELKILSEKEKVYALMKALDPTPPKKRFPLYSV